MKSTFATIASVTLVSLTLRCASAANQAPLPPAATSPDAAANNSPPAEQPQSADALFAQIKSMEVAPPDPVRRRDPTYFAAYIDEARKLVARRAELAKQFVQTYPQDPRKPDALFIRAICFVQLGDQPQAFADAASAFLDAAPHDARGAELLLTLGREQKDLAKRHEVYRRLIDRFPDHESAKLAKGEIRQVEGLGKPFELEFTDAITGRRVSMKDLRGKIVIVDFWATWCGPCVAEMPRMKALYSKYREYGVEFVGVNLDEPESEGGLVKMKAFVAEHQIGWPQYYQGKGWDSEFSREWGVSGIPRLFAVDHRGNLRSNDAGRVLEETIVELIRQRDSRAR